MCVRSDDPMRKASAVFFLLIALGVAASTADETPKPTSEQVQFFEAKVRPILAERCFKCHGKEKQNNALRLDLAASFKTGGDSGPVVVPGKPEESLLIEAVNHDGLKMPPKEKLKPEEIAVLT